MSVGVILNLGRRRASAQWSQPVYRAGWLLAGGSVVTAVAGVAFWLSAAHLYPPQVVGANSSLISAMMFLAGVAQLNLMSAVLRFVPGAGERAGRLVLGFYAVALSTSAVAAAIFLLGIGTFAPALVPLLSSGPQAFFFVAATMAWTLYVLHCATLVAVGQAGASTLATQTFNLTKLALLLGFAVAVPGAGVWFSWTVAMALVVAGAIWYYVARAYPRFVAARRAGPAIAPTLRELVRYVGPDYVAALAWIACTTLPPILVIDLTGPSEAAVFALAWSMCFVLLNVPASFGQSLVAHGPLEPHRLEERHRKVLAYSLGMVAPAVTVLVVLAPWILRLFGSWYVEVGTTTLRLLALAAVPNCVVALAVSRARVQRRMRVVVGTMITLSVGVLGGTLLAVPAVGIAGAGLAWLLAECVVATWVGLRWVGPHLVAPPWPTVPRRTRRRAVRRVADDGWAPERTLRSVSDSSVVLLRSTASSAALKVATGEPGVRSLAAEGRVLQQLAADERLGTWRRMVPAVLGSWHDARGGYLLLTRLPGAPPDHRSPGCLTHEVFRAIAPLHRLESSIVAVDARLLDRWVGAPVAALAHALPDGEVVRTGLVELEHLLRRRLEGRSVTLGWSHGDLHPGNLLVWPDGVVRGILDWGGARPDSFPALDPAHWLLTAASAHGHRALGKEVADRLGRREYWQPGEAALIRSAACGHGLPDDALLLLTWLSHVRMNLEKSARYAASPLWWRRNVLPVLHAVQDGGGMR